MRSPAEKWNTEYVLGPIGSLECQSLALETLSVSVPRESERERVRTRWQMTSYFTWGYFSSYCLFEDFRDLTQGVGLSCQSDIWWRITSQMCPCHVSITALCFGAAAAHSHSEAWHGSGFLWWAPLYLFDCSRWSSWYTEPPTARGWTSWGKNFEGEKRYSARIFKL